MPFRGSILSQIFGDKEFSDIDKRIDDLSDRLPRSSYSNVTSPEESTSNLINNFVSDGDSDGDSESDIDSIFQHVSVPRERQARYNLYDEIVKSVPLISRILKVYSSNVVQKNPTTGESLIFKQEANTSGEEGDKGKESEEFMDDFFTTFDISRKLRNTILPKQLKYGDCYAEILSTKDEKVDISSATSSTNVINEANDLKTELDKIGNNSNLLSAFESSLVKLSQLIVDVDVNVDNDQSNTDDVENQDTSRRNTRDFNDIIFKIHYPHNIIVLQTKYGTCLGYLEVQKQDHATSFNFSQALSGIVGKVNQLSNSKGQDDEQITNKLVYHVLNQVIKKTKDEGVSDLENKDSEAILQSLDKNVYDLIKRLFIEQGLNKKKGSNINPIRARFIPTTRMVTFSNPNTSDYDPYSQSIIEDLILPGKLYMLNQLSNSVMKLSRSSVLRKWTLDIGPQRMGGQNLQKLKREIYNSRITLDDLNSFKSIPNIMSDYKDLFVFSQNGQTPVDVETTSFGDPNIKTEDLEDQRKEMIALSGVPAPYLGLHDVVELREQLVHSNVSFANEVINIQENINDSLNQIADIVGKIKGLNYRPSDYVKVNLLPPVVLLLQVVESTLSSVGNVAGIFQNLGLDFDPYYFLKQYVPHIDWDDFRDKAQQYKSITSTRTDLGGEEEQGGGGMF